MRVLFDLDAAVRNKHSGFYTLAAGLLPALDRVKQGPEMTLLFQERYQAQAGKILARLGPRATPRACPFKFRWIQKLWDFLSFPSLEHIAGGFDVYHCFHHFMPPAARGPRILMVHDLRRYILPELYPRSKTKPFETAVRRADHFIAVSKATKRDLCAVFHIPSQRVDVVPLACSLEIPDHDAEKRHKIRKELCKRFNLPFRNYLLAFSSKDKRKNIKRISEAFLAVLPRLPRDTGLVIIGPLPSGFRGESRDIFTPGTVDDIIPWLVSSKGLVFSSLYEGFGLPVLEGFAARIPVITSNCSSMPEVAGEAAILVDPRDTRQIGEAIKAILLDERRAQALREEGSRRLKAFSWEKSAAKTINIYKRLIRGHSGS